MDHVHGLSMSAAPSVLIGVVRLTGESTPHRVGLLHCNSRDCIRWSDDIAGRVSIHYFPGDCTAIHAPCMSSSCPALPAPMLTLMAGDQLLIYD